MFPSTRGAFDDRVDFFAGLAVKIVPKGVDRLRGKYHIMASICAEPGFTAGQTEGSRRDATGRSSESWECGMWESKRNPPLVHAPECRVDSLFPDNFLTMQYQGGGEEEGALVLPPGTGIPVSRGYGNSALVLTTHFPHRTQSLDGWTGRSEVEVTLRQTRQPLKSVASLVIAAYGFVGRQSVGQVSASALLTQDMEILSAYTHTHDLAVNVSLWVETSTGGVLPLVQQESPFFLGIKRISPSPVVRSGDRLRLICTYDNRLDVTLRIE